MIKRNWKNMQPISTSQAMELCLLYAKERHNLSIDQVADRMGVNKWTLYKWIAKGNPPINMIRSFEHGCQSPAYVTRHLCHSAHLMAIDIPSGKKAQAHDVNELQLSCTQAMEAVIKFTNGDMDADTAIQSLTQTIENLAYQRGNIRKHTQPDLIEESTF